MYQKIRLFPICLGLFVLSIQGCERPQTQAQSDEALVASVQDQVVAKQAVEAALSSPETAMRLAKDAPEATAVIAAEEAEKALKQIHAAPEAAALKVDAYAKLAMAAAQVIPESVTAQEAAQQVQRIKARIDTTVPENRIKSINGSIQ